VTFVSVNHCFNTKATTPSPNTDTINRLSFKVFAILTVGHKTQISMTIVERVMVFVIHHLAIAGNQTQNNSMHQFSCPLAVGSDIPIGIE